MRHHPNWCDHLLIRVVSASAEAAGLVRRVCVRSNCELEERVSPDDESLIWKNANYGRFYNWKILY